MKPLAISLAVSGVLTLSPSLCSPGDEPKEPGVESAEIARLASQSLLLDAAMAGSRMVVVGERGHVLLSDDQGRTWRQSQVPTRSNLTGVFFLNAQLGWAVGHDEIILRSEDGGETWTRQHYAPEKEQPLLDVWFGDADNGLAFGAYGTILSSHDGGRTWSEQIFEPQPLIEKPAAAKAAAGTNKADEYDVEGAASDMHLNAVAYSADGKLYLAAEAGHLFRSDDNGATWLELPSPYEGSFFGVLPLEPPSLLAFGLRGHLFRSDDAGATWQAIASNTTAMLTNAVRVDVETIVITGLAGALLVSHDGGRTFELRAQEDRKGFSAALRAEASLVTIGEAGIKSIEMPGTTP
jgi:photosystem II stability/assembly factor-like uncharacterized protein